MQAWRPQTCEIVASCCADSPVALTSLRQLESGGISAACQADDGMCHNAGGVANAGAQDLQLVAVRHEGRQRLRHSRQRATRVPAVRRQHGATERDRDCSISIGRARLLRGDAPRKMLVSCSTCTAAVSCNLQVMAGRKQSC